MIARWREVEEICHSALRRPPSDRAAFVAEACAGDGDMRAEVESLLAEEATAEVLFEQTAWDSIAESLTAEAEFDDQTPGGRECIRPKRFGHFRILGDIGTGGTGTVYRARDERLDRDVALKVLHSSSGDDPGASNRLLREARSAAALNHPNICSVYEVSESGGQAFIAMELADGDPLSDLLSRGPLSLPEVARLGRQLADALAHAHERGVVHRDFKTGNIVVSPAGAAKVLDFGLAKRSRGTRHGESEADAAVRAAGLITGTLPYMAPELLRGAEPDARADVWALGVVLYEMLAGRRPFVGETPPALIRSIISDAPSPLPAAVPVHLRAIVARCLEKIPEHRFQRADAVLRAFNGAPQGAASTGHGLGATVGRQSMVFALLAVAVAALVSAASWDRVTAVTSAPRPGWLAVLPLEDLSAERSRPYLAGLLHEALITELSGVQGLSVIQRPTVKRFEQTRKAPGDIARELGVEWIITGTVVESGSRVQVTAHLLNAASDRAVWNGRYDCVLTDVLQLEADIVAALAQALQLRVAPERRARLARTIRSETLEAIAFARSLARQASPHGFARAVERLTAAIRSDPDEPLGYAALAMVYSMMAHEGVPGAQAKAGAPARKAIELDPLLADAHQALGETKTQHDWDLAGGATEFREAMRLNPSLPDAHAHYSWYLSTLLTRREEQFAEMQRAESLDPLNPLYSTWLGQMYLMHARNEAAIAQAQKALAIDRNFLPASTLLVQAYSASGRHQAAILLARRLAAQDSRTQLVLAQALVDGGRMTEARRLATALEATIPHHASEAWFMARLYGTMGDNPMALAWLQRLVASRHIWAPWIESEYRLDGRLTSLRGHPGYLALLATIHPAGR